MGDDYEAIRDALDDLASAVNDRYAGYPATDRRYVRDLAVVTQASAALQRLESRPTPEQSRETRDASEDGDKFRAILVAVIGEIQKDDGRYDGNAPGHAHYIPGIWDSDNGAKAGKPCSWCRTWKLARESLGLDAAMDRSALGREESDADKA